MRIGLLFLSGALFLACAAADEPAASSGDGSGGSGGSAGAGSGAGGSQPSCDDFSNTAPVIQETEVAGAVPSAFGGTILDGTYHQTGAVHYTTATPGPPGEPVHGTLVISGSIWRRLYADGADVARGNDSCIVWSVTTSGTVLIVDTSMQFSYSATPSQLELYSESNAVTYALQ